MAKLPNRLVIEITNTDKVDELGNPVIGFESKDYDECIIEELEKIKEEILEYHCIKCYGTCETYCPYSDCIEPKEVIEDLKIIDKHISELKGEKE